MIRQIYFSDANYPDEKNWLSKGDVNKFLNSKIKKWRQLVKESESNAKAAKQDFQGLKRLIK